MSVILIHYASVAFRDSFADFIAAHPMGSDPLGYLEFVVESIAREGFAVLPPTHEQAYLFASARDRLPPTVGVALASFESFERLDDVNEVVIHERLETCKSLA
jgi:hypothetical protein